MMRLEADRVPFSFYEGQAIERGIPLTTGIGSSQIDRNSIGDINIAKEELLNVSQEFVSAIKNVCKTIGAPSNALNRQPWPSHIYFEDVNGQSEFELIEIIIKTARENGALGQIN